MIPAGDTVGTKTRLALYQIKGDSLEHISLKITSSLVLREVFTTYLLVR